MKYELTENKKIYGDYDDIELRQIRALKDFGNVKAGDLGGWIENKNNLSQEGNAMVYGSAMVYDSAWVYGSARVSGSAGIKSNNDYCMFTGFGSANRTTTAYRTKNNTIQIACGCFRGTLDEFLEAVEKTHGDSKHGREYKAIIEVIKIKFYLLK